MQKTIYSLLFVFAVALGSVVNASQSKDKAEGNFIGAWSGTWTGSSSGKFELTISKGDGSRLYASLTATPDQGDGYTVDTKTLEVSGDKLTAKFEAPGGDEELILIATMDRTGLKGNYSVRVKAQSEEVDKGNFSANKK